jgi:NAD(P)H-hydrate epimerase
VIPVVTPEEMQAIDAVAPEPVETLIGRAGRAVARAALAELGGAYGRVVAVVAGKGNNGADGRFAGAELARRGVRVHVFEVGSCPAVLPPADLVLDAAFGTGFRGEWSAPSTGDTPVLAVDVPSGVHAATGVAGPGVLPARRTVTFQALKPGLLFGAGATLAGEVEVADIGLDVSGASVHVVEAGDVAGWWPARPVDSHKWRDAVAVVAGSPGMLGAGELCAAAAARAGAGLVRLSSPGGEARARSEIIQLHVPSSGWEDAVLSDLHRFGALVVGPGLGRAADTVAAVRRVVAQAPVPVVVDGDGLFALAGEGGGAGAIVEVLAGRRAPTVLTPHDGEYARLAGRDVGDDRLGAATELADSIGGIVLLKGPATVVAGGRGVLVVDNGDQRLATAGSGDVLAGVIAAALARGVDPLRAAAAGAWLHADAAGRGPATGLLAGDVVELLPAASGALGSARAGGS